MKKNLVLSLLLVSLALPTRAADTSSASVEDRLQKLEQELNSLRRENQDLRRELGVGPTTNTNFVKSGARSAGEIRLGGYVQAQAEFGDPGDARWTGLSSNDRFYVRRARLAVYGSFLEDFTYRLEGDFAGALGQQTGLRAQLTDGWASYNPLDFLNVRLGQFFPTFGWEKRLSPVLEQSVELSLATDRLLPDRQLGVQASGGVLDNRLRYYLGLFNGNNMNNNFNDNEAFQVVPRIEGTAWKGKIANRDSFVNVGISAFTSDDNAVAVAPEYGFAGNTFAGYRYALGADAQIRIGPVDLWFEQMMIQHDPAGSRPDFTTYGGYAQATYLITPKIQALAKYEYYDPDDDVDGDWTTTGTLGLAYLFRGDNLKVMLNYLLMDVPNQDDLQNKVLIRMQAAF